VMANRLTDSTSPYLLQHKDNPVDWWQWGPDALAEAERLSKPILLSIGYAACPWCHVPVQRPGNRTSRARGRIGAGQRGASRAASCRMIHRCGESSTLAGIVQDALPVSFCRGFRVDLDRPQVRLSRDRGNLVSHRAV